MYGGAASSAQPEPWEAYAVNGLRTLNNWLLPGLSGTYEGAVEAGKAAASGQDPLAAFRRGRARNEAGQVDFRARHPIASVAAGTIGGALPGWLTGGAANDVTVAQNLTQRPLMRMAQNAATGAAVNAPVGALQSIDDPARIGESTLGAAGTGAAGAVGLGMIAERAPAAWRALANIGRRVPDVRVDSSMIGANGANVRLVPRPQTTRQGVEQNIIRLARRSRITPAMVDETMGDFANAGTAPLAAQVLREAGLQRGQTLASVPGATPQIAADVIRGRQRGQREGIETAFERVAPGTQRSGVQADAALTDARQSVNRDAFGPALRQTPDPAQQPRINAILKRIPPRVLERANSLVDDLAHIDGVTPANMSPGQRLYYTKRALSGSIEEMSREGLNADMRSALTRLSNEYVSALQDSMPGLRPAMERFGQIARAREVYEAGQNFMRQNVDDLARIRTSASDIEREYAEVGWRDYVASVLDRNRDGRTNLAEMFASDGFRRRTEALLGPERAEPLLRALRTRAQDFRDMASMTPRANSKTAPVFMDLLDQEQGAIPTTKAGIANAVLGAVRNPLAEHARNIEGRALFSTMTPQRALALKQALIDAGIRLRPVQFAAPAAAASNQP